MGKQKVHRRQEYLLKHKTTGKYYAGGGLHQYRLTSNKDKAIVWTGAKLKDMAWDWGLGWRAIRSYTEDI